MAIKLNYTLESGFEAEYWKIAAIRSFDINDSTAEVELHLFKDQAARENGLQPALVKFERVPINDIRADVYASLKQTLLQGGEDV